MKQNRQIASVIGKDKKMSVLEETIKGFVKEGILKTSHKIMKSEESHLQNLIV